ncbi:MAG: hypothetical protein V3T72_21880, partial [Thermoanaerobaculia bacterium]
MAVGLAGYRSWRNAYRRCTGENPELGRLPERLSPDFDNPTWHHARRGAVSVDDVRVLLSRLRGLDTGTVVAPRGDQATPDGGRTADDGRGEISDAEARTALRRAAAETRERLLADAEGLPSNVVKVLEDLADNLFDPDFSVDGCRQRAKVTETAISTRVGFYLGDTLPVRLEKLRVEIAMRLVGDFRFKIEQIAEKVGCSPRRFLRACHRRAGASAGEVRKTLKAAAGDPDYQLWCRAGRGTLSRASVLKLEDFLRRLLPEMLVPAGSLAIRSDVDPRRVADVLQLCRAVGDREPEALRTLDDALRTHPDYSAAHWYGHWVRDRLGHESLDAAWEDWQTANRDLAQLLEQPREQRLELVREVRKFQTDAFLWLLVDCVEVRLFHDGAESEHYADLAVAAAEARWLATPDPKSTGFRGLTLALKANAVRRRGEFDEASETFEQALATLRPRQLEPWIIGRTYCLYATFLFRAGEDREALRALFVASSNYKRAGDELGRLRCINDRASAWLSMGKDPSRLLTMCIRALDRYPSTAELRILTHLNRILVCLYLTDRLNGHHLSEIKSFREAMPPADSAYIAAEYEQVDGLIAALDRQPEIAGAALKRAAVWFEDHELPADAACCRLQASWATTLAVEVPGPRRK